MSNSPHEVLSLQYKVNILIPYPSMILLIAVNIGTNGVVFELCAFVFLIGLLCKNLRFEAEVFGSCTSLL